MRFPDFFIIGAPKCGTTALYSYLADHPRIFMSYPKEPNYYCADLVPIRRTPTLQEYEEIFCDAPGAATCGEASPWYLYSHEAIGLILKDRPDAKFIVCLRNPVDMFLSYHRQLHFNLIGEFCDAEQAWRHQGPWPAQAGGSAVSAVDDRPDYAGICRLGKQVQQLLQHASRANVQIILFDDIFRDTRGVYERVLDFLGVPGDGRTDFPVHNQRKTHRLPALTKLLMRPPFPLNYIKRAVVRLVRLKWKNPPSIYDGMLSKPAPKSVVREGFREELVAFFAEDVKLLEKLIDRDLTQWRR